jgi:hypothetical protein
MQFAPGSWYFFSLLIAIKLNSVALVRERTIPTERPPPFGEVRGVTWSAQRIPTAINLCFLDLEPLLFIQVAPQLTSRGSRGWVDPVPNQLLLRKSGSAGNQTRDLCISGQKLWPLEYRGGPWKQLPFPKLSMHALGTIIYGCFAGKTIFNTQGVPYMETKRNGVS